VSRPADGQFPPVAAIGTMNPACDIFCHVIDNFGDAGVCWRLARQMVSEHQLAVRLWITDLDCFRRLCPQADPLLRQQRCQGVEVCRWDADMPAVTPAALVIEAFACQLPRPYLLAMAEQSPPPVWINLEYLSAEFWVDGCHQVASPSPDLPLTKYFFFPGFSRNTGGLLLEQDLIARREAFDTMQKAAFWQSLNIPAPSPGTLCVSLFCYENNGLPDLLEAWSRGPLSVLCLVPEGRVIPLIERYAGGPLAYGKPYTKGNLQVQKLPFVAQAQYDALLWACDINIVRGEDSFVRALWAGKPFVWHIYPQHDDVHWVKLQAFLDRYLPEMSTPAGTDASSSLSRHGGAAALGQFWKAWNAGRGMAEAWNAFLPWRQAIASPASNWARFHADNRLTRNLLYFWQEIAKLPKI